MASIMRSSILRQTFAAGITARTSSTGATAYRFKASRPLQTQSLASRIASPSAVRVAAFHASQRRSILPPLPQTVEGTVNDAAKTPEPHPFHGAYHWSFERAMSVALVPLTIAPFVAGSVSPVVDSLLAASILIHSHIGFQSIIIDYLPSYRMPGVRKMFMWLLNAATVLVGVGFYEYETNDVGLCEGIKRIWRA